MSDLEHRRHSDADLERATDERWLIFRQRLTHHLQAMCWGDEPDTLHVAVEPVWGDDELRLPYARFEITMDRRLRVTVPADRDLTWPSRRRRSELRVWPPEPPTLDPVQDVGAEEFGFRAETPDTYTAEGSPTDAEDLALRTVAILRRAFGVRHPLFLGYQATGPHAETASQLGISKSADIHDAQIWSLSFGLDLEAVARLLDQVAVALSRAGRKFHRDGDYLMVDDAHAPFRITAPTSKPGFLIVSAEIVTWQNVRISIPAKLEALQSGEACCSWTPSGDRVVQRMAVPAMPFDPRHFDLALKRFNAEAIRAQDVLVFEALADPARPPSPTAQLRLLSPDGTSLAVIPVTHPNQRGDTRRTGYHLVDVELVGTRRVVRHLDRWFAHTSLLSFADTLLAIGLDEHPERSASDFADGQSGIHLRCINSDEKMVDLVVRCSIDTESGVNDIDTLDLRLTRATLIAVAHHVTAWTHAHSPLPNDDDWVPEGWT